MTEDKGTLVPQIRFRGFTDAWVQRKLGEVAEIKTGPFGSTLHAEDYVDDGMPIITTEHFKSGDLPVNKNGIPQVSDMDYKRLKQYLLVKGDIVFSRVGSVDINALVLEFQEGWMFSGRVLRVRPDKNILGLFLHYELDTTRAKNDVTSRAVGQTMPSINTEILKDTTVYISELLPEQTIIGNFFHTIDDTITLYKRKLDGLKELKKGYLQQMFPQAGKDVPQLRFTGFAGNWEKMRLGEVSTKVGRRNSNGEDFPAYSINNQVGFIPQGEQFEDSRLDNLNKDAYKIVEPNDFAYNPARVNVGSIAFNNLAKSVIISSLYVVVKMDESVDNGFVLQYIMSPEFITEVRKNTEGTVREYLFYENFANIAFPFAPIKAEQAAIGNFFRNIDEQILDQQSKLDKLKQLKSAYLQKMFI